MRKFYRSLARILIGVSILVVAPLCALPQTATATDSEPTVPAENAIRRECL